MRREGIAAAKQASNVFYDNISRMKPSEYRRHAPEILACWRKLGESLDREFGYPGVLNDYRKYGALPAEELTGLFSLRLEARRIHLSRSLDAAEKIRAYEKHLETFRKYDFGYHIGVCLLEMAGNYRDLGDAKAQRTLLRQAVRTFASCEEHYMLCQALGALGASFSGTAEYDSMRICYDEALRVATERRFPDQAPRIISFYAAHYASIGRLGLAHELYGEAIDVCRDYRGRFFEIRHVRNSMKFHADLECWNVVSNLAERERMLERLYANFYDDPIYLYRARIDEARMTMARGDVAGAEKILRKIERPIARSRHDREVLPELLYHWARGLMDHGLARRAVPKIEKGLRFSRAKHYEAAAARFALLLAEARLDAGDALKTGELLAQFDSYAAASEENMRREHIRRDILAVRLAERTGPPGAFAPALSRSLARFVERVAATEPSPQGYLWIDEADEYRGMLHECAASDPVLGYGAELLWRDFYRFLGAGERRRGDTADASGALEAPGTPDDAAATAAALATGELMDLLRSRAERARERIGRARAAHCLYRCGEHEIVRWTVTAAGIRREPLDVAPDGLRSLVTETFAILSARGRDAGAPLEPALAANLRELARVLLPEELRRPAADASRPALYVTADKYLEAIPFEALDVGDGVMYRPLLMTRDVAYLRFVEAPARPRSRGPGVILVNESRAGARASAPAQRLVEATKEAEALAALDPHAAFLAGGGATKEALLARWENASYLYIASHAFRHPETPYLTIIPLAPSSGGAAAEFSSLDFSDVRAADLSRCGVVVLSGCSTGAPYVEPRAVGPAFGDAFLDAGAGAAVDTFWDVRDDDARALMEDFARHWRGNGLSPVEALCQARRDIMMNYERGGRPAGNGIRHPSTWAAYAVTVSDLSP
jgi:tetratricopeptide (TPR) repeat protein